MAQSFYLDVSGPVQAMSPITGKITQIAVIIDNANNFSLTDDVGQNHAVFTLRNQTSFGAALVIPVEIPVKIGTPLTGIAGYATLTISP